MREIVGSFTAGAAPHSRWRDLEPGRPGAAGGESTTGRQIGSRLPELTNGWVERGGAVRPMTGHRGGRDPGGVTLGRGRHRGGRAAAGMSWGDAGPVQAEERPGEYVHDGAVSVSWVMGEAPRGAVRSTVMRRLLEPHHEISRKRVTILYRPYTPAKAAELVDNDVLDARFNATQRRNVRARDQVNVAAATKAAARRSAHGAGLVRFAIVVTGRCRRTARRTVSPGSSRSSSTSAGRRASGSAGRGGRRRRRSPPVSPRVGAARPRPLPGDLEENVSETLKRPRRLLVLHDGPAAPSSSLRRPPGTGGPAPGRSK